MERFERENLQALKAKESALAGALDTGTKAASSGLLVSAGVFPSQGLLGEQSVTPEAVNLWGGWGTYYKPH